MFQPRETFPTQLQNAPSSAGTIFNAERLIELLRRQWPLVASVTAGTLFLVIVYLLTATPLYTASSSILMDTRQSQVFVDKDAGTSNMLIDPGFVESQVQILTSENLILTIVRAMNLDKDPEFTGSSEGIIPALMKTAALVIGSDAPPSKEQLERAAVEALKKNLNVERVGVTYVLTISFRSSNAEKAAKIANAIADAYIVGGLEAKYESAKRAGQWLQNRSAELREQATAADRAVQTFKAENNIVGTSRGLMSEQQLTDVNTQLIQARSATAEAKARLDRIDAITEKDLVQSTVTDALSNNVITRLRAQYLDLSAQYADIASRFGNTHQAAVLLSNRMDELRKSIFDEVKRIGDGYRSDYEIAKSREKSIEDSLKTLVKEASSNSQAQVKLHNLESVADTDRNLYNNFLERLQTATQQETFPISDARIISTAVTPNKKSYPKPLLFLIGGVLGGLVLGVGTVITKEFMNDVFRSGAEIENYLGVTCLGVLPAIDKPKDEPLLKTPIPMKVPGPWPLKNNSRLDLTRAGQGSLSHFVVDHPFSRYAEILRNIKVSIDVMRLSREMKVIGIVSSLPKEGKTTVSSNLGHLTAMTGYKTLLIDGDLCTRTLTQDLAPEAEAGLIETLAKPELLDKHVIKTKETELNFLPAVLETRMVNSADVLASQAMADLLKTLRTQYDYVFLDLAPLMAVTDAKAISHLIDGIVYVVEWGQTSRTAVVESISTAEAIREKLIGVVLNRADPKMLKRIESYRGAHCGDYYIEPR